MKRILVVPLFLVSFASVALAEGPDLPPVMKPTKPPIAGTVLLAEGPDLPPVMKPTKPPAEGLAA